MPRRSPPPSAQLSRVDRITQINHTLATLYPDAHCELNFSTPLELAVATILSAQCTDVRVNAVTPQLFSKYRTAHDYAHADPVELEAIIRPTGFFRNKTRSLIGLGQTLVERFHGQIPRSMDELITLPGVGRKTANVILGNAFHTPGIPVDTHVSRLVQRWQLTDTRQRSSAENIEKTLQNLLPEEEWTMFSHRTIFHGRRVCFARRPACGKCALADLCPSYGIGPT